MKTIEQNHGGDWRDRLLNSWPFLLDTDDVKTLFAFAYCKDGGEWRRFRDDTSLFNNGTLFVRYTVSPITNIFWSLGTFLAIAFSVWWLLLFTYGLFLHLSWRERGNKRYLQTGFGPKLNGRLGAIFRVPKNDQRSSSGAHENAPNHGQASGWSCGTK